MSGGQNDPSDVSIGVRMKEGGSLTSTVKQNTSSTSKKPTLEQPSDVSAFKLKLKGNLPKLQNLHKDLKDNNIELRAKNI